VKVLIVDNFDSFTYNLFHYVEQCDAEVVVIRNDELTLESIEEFDKIILSPGPGLPSETARMFDVIERFAGQKPILGVCLGMQGIAEFYGAKLRNQEQVKHGVQTKVNIDCVNANLYQGLPEVITVGLYHSWCVDENSLPDFLKVTGVSEQHVVMSIEHTTLPVFGVQFHPESVMTEYGMQILRNFLNL
jgi:anthranilate synthase component 2